MQPTVVRTQADIKRIVSEFDPKRSPHYSEVPLNTTLEETDGGKKIVYSVSAATKSKSKRDTLIEGLSLVQKREEISSSIRNASASMEINGREMRPASFPNNIDGHSWVDPLIHQWTGGVRKGVMITWDIGDSYEYRYDVFGHKLTRIPKST
jgi:hypothetical protein